MKKTLLFATTAIILLTFSCRKEITKDEVPDEESAFITEAKSKFYTVSKNNQNLTNQNGYFTNSTSSNLNKPSILPL
jgi:hypothetical protein